jgi:hypothetical protein
MILLLTLGFVKKSLSFVGFIYCDLARDCLPKTMETDEGVLKINFDGIKSEYMMLLQGK